MHGGTAHESISFPENHLGLTVFLLYDIIFNPVYQKGGDSFGYYVDLHR